MNLYGFEIYKETAEKLYPENYVGQKAYIDASMKEYFKIIEFIKNNKSLIKLKSRCLNHANSLDTDRKYWYSN